MKKIRIYRNNKTTYKPQNYFQYHYDKPPNFVGLGFFLLCRVPWTAMLLDVVTTTRRNITAACRWMFLWVFIYPIIGYPRSHYEFKRYGHTRSQLNDTWVVRNELYYIKHYRCVTTAMMRYIRHPVVPMHIHWILSLLSVHLVLNILLKNSTKHPDL